MKGEGMKDDLRALHWAMTHAPWKRVGGRIYAGFHLVAKCSHDRDAIAIVALRNLIEEIALDPSRYAASD